MDAGGHHLQSDDYEALSRDANEARRIAAFAFGIWAVVTLGILGWIQIAPNNSEHASRVALLGPLAIVSPPLLIAVAIIYGASVIARAVEGLHPNRARDPNADHVGETKVVPERAKEPAIRTNSAEPGVETAPCPKCGTPIRHGVGSCQRCGAEIEWE